MYYNSKKKRLSIKPSKTVAMSGLAIFTLLISMFAHTTAQTTPKEDQQAIKYGMYGGVNLNAHSADFSNLNGIPNCCPNFESGNGIGFHGGILYEYRLSNQLWIGGRLGIMTLDGELTKEEPTGIILPTGPAEGVFEHRMTGFFTNISFEPTMMYNPIGGLFVSTGLRVGINTTTDFDQIEEITEPAGFGTFLDSLGNDTFERTRNAFSGEIPDAIPFQMFWLGSVGYELPLNSDASLRLTPEVAYYFPLTDLVENTGWNVNSIRAGIAIKYVPFSEPPKVEIFKEEMLIDTLKIESDAVTANTFRKGQPTTKTAVTETPQEIITTETTTRTDTIFTPKAYTLTGNITAVGVDSIGREIPNPTFVVEEFASTRQNLLLEYIFFEDNSAELPERYKQLTQANTESFSLDSLNEESTLGVYYHILNIIGKRMQAYPKAKITLKGCNSGTGTEKGNTELSQQRAETVRDYLVSTWNIAPERFTMEVRNIPEKASLPITEPDKIAENRRVEITFEDKRVFEPVSTNKITRVANPPVLRFKPEAYAEAGLAKWEIRASQESFEKSDSKAFRQSGETSMLQTIDWVLEQNQDIIPASPQSVQYSLYLKDTRNQDTVISKQTPPVEILTISKKRTERLGDYEIERYSLISFGFNNATIEGKNKEILDYVRSRIQPESQIEIEGYSDRTGNANYNQQLSERRANAIKTALNRQDAVAKGIGEEVLLYDNDVPEGRFYSRTVQITIKTKVD